MGERNRKIIHKYKLHSSMNEYICFYCNSYGEARDHIPPVSYPDEVIEHERMMVRSCLLCNSLLGGRLLLTLLSRCDFLLSRYQYKFRKCLSMPIWTDEELDELKGKLKRSVVLGIKKKKFIENKILSLMKNINLLQGYDSYETGK